MEVKNFLGCEKILILSKKRKKTTYSRRIGNSESRRLSDSDSLMWSHRGFVMVQGDSVMNAQRP